MQIRRLQNVYYLQDDCKPSEAGVLDAKIVPYNTMADWYYRGAWPRDIPPSPLIMALHHHDAYNITCEVQNHLSGYAIFSTLHQVLPVPRHYSTVYRWTTGTRPSITPLRIVPETATAVALLLTDGEKKY